MFRGGAIDIVQGMRKDYARGYGLDGHHDGAILDIRILMTDLCTRLECCALVR